MDIQHTLTRGLSFLEFLAGHGLCCFPLIYFSFKILAHGLQLI